MAVVEHDPCGCRRVMVGRDPSGDERWERDVVCRDHGLAEARESVARAKRGASERRARRAGASS